MKDRMVGGTLDVKIVLKYCKELPSLLAPQAQQYATLNLSFRKETCLDMKPKQDSNTHRPM